MFYFIIALITCLLARSPVQAEELNAFDQLIKLDASGELQVQENLSYDFGAFPKNGIVRNLPTTYYHSNYHYQPTYQDFQVTNLPFEVHSYQDYLRVQIGDPQNLISGYRDYNLSYRVAGALSHQSDGSMLYWPLSGYNWPVEIRNFSAHLELPRAITADEISAECFVGLPNATSSCDRLRLLSNDSGLINSLEIYQSQIPPGQGLSLALKLPNDLTDQPSFFQFFKRRPLISLIIIISFCSIIWLTLTRKTGKSQTTA